MKIRNFRYIYFSSITQTEILLAVILILTGIAFVLPQEHFNQAGNNLLNIDKNISLWGSVFCMTGAASLIRIWWHKKPNWVLTEILRHTTNFLYSVLSLSMLAAYPFLPWTSTYITLAIAAFFCAVRFDRREHITHD